MTPEEAETIYHEACTVEFTRHMHEQSPVNQRKGILAGFKAVIDAVTQEIDSDNAKRYLLMSQYDFTGKRGIPAPQDAAESGERS